MLTRPPPAPRTRTTGLAPPGAQVRPFGGLTPFPASSSQHMKAPPSCAAPLYLAPPPPSTPPPPPPPPPSPSCPRPAGRRARRPRARALAPLCARPACARPVAHTAFLGHRPVSSRRHDPISTSSPWLAHAL